ncbi:MAG TPA: hypothetical protein VK427_17545, partial [Kofleriaceae bacterium]|nr:hypothetical protein [Kofleriaceae bacterium]
ESVVVNRQGRVRVIDLALGPGTAAAMVAGLIPPQSSVAPELLAGGTIDGTSDVYGVGALLYEVLVGKSLERGGPRPSDVVQGVNTQIDEIVARACHRDPEKRFGRVDVLGEVVSEALTKGGAVQTSAVPLLDKLDAETRPATEPAPPSPAASLTGAPAASGGAIDRALAAALADSTEKWLVSKGRLDYGPFSLQDVVDQIESGQVVAGNIIMDKDTGARVDVAAHPLLGPMVDAAKQKRDDARRAHAEVQVAKSQTKKGAVLYGLIGLGIAGVVAGGYFVIQALRKDEGTKIDGVSKIEGASLKVSVSVPKKPPPQKRTGGGGRAAGAAGNYTRGSEDLALDLSDEGDEGGESLDMGTVYQVYSKYGGQLGGCLHASGESSANIYINIDGPTGRVQFVKINGKQAGPLYGCLNGVLRRMKFPSINGPRTRAEFDISM